MSLLGGGVVDLQVVGFVGCCGRLCICLIVWCWLEFLLMCCICGLSRFCGLDCYGCTLLVVGLV